MGITNQRVYERVPFRKRTRLWLNGRLVSSALAVNISMGGLLLAPLAFAPVGSVLEVELPGNQKVDGRVVRSDASGTAIQFQQGLDEKRFQTVAQAPSPNVFKRLGRAYMDYMRAGQSKDDAVCERLLGVSRQVYNRVFLTTFVSSISLAILAAWLGRALYMHYGTGLKIGMSFGYGALVMAAVQPAIDMSLFRWLRRRQV